MRTAATLFKAVGVKRLKMIDLPNRGSNQHEVQGITVFREMFGTAERKKLRSLWRGLGIDGVSLCEAQLELTWYNARERSKTRPPEWRLFYPRESPMEHADVGDLLIVAIPQHGGPLAYLDVVLYVIPWKSDFRAEVLAALGMDEPPEKGARTAGTNALKQAQLLAMHEEILRTLEPAFDKLAEPPEVGREVEEAFAKFLRKPATTEFPTTMELALFAQKRATIPPSSDPDGALDGVLDIETRAFHVLEQHSLEARLRAGFVSVEDFMTTARSALNRRMSRRGLSVEHHLAWVFDNAGLAFERQAKTDGDTTIDFLFPGIKVYRTLPKRALPGCGVVALASKSSAKERWRQVLEEARKLKHKYLFTLQAGISAAQRTQMRRAGLSLVIPAARKRGYAGAAAKEILSVGDFVALVRAERS